MLHEAHWKYRTQKNRHFGTIVQLCRAISSELKHVLTIGKNFLNSNTSSTCPDNMVYFGLLTSEICWRVWSTPANFNGFRVLAALLQGTLVVSVSETAALNRGRHLYSAGWPSRWALAHILVVKCFSLVIQCFPSIITSTVLQLLHEFSLSHELIKAKVHQASWFEAGSKLVRSWSPTSFEAASIMEFGLHKVQ